MTNTNGATEPGEGIGVMAGGGYYDRHSATQGHAATLGIESLVRAASAVDVGEGSTARIADLGAAQGHNALAPLRAAVDELTGRGVDAIDVVHTDLPSNDWTTLFDVVENDPDSYLHGHDHAHPYVMGRSFFGSLFAPGSLHVGWTSGSLHWLSESPRPVADHFFAQRSTDDVAKARAAACSAADWTTFLSHRAAELVPSGSVVFVDVLMGDDGLMGSEALFDALEAALRAAGDGGLLSPQEYADAVYPTWFRSLDDLRAPFTPDFVGPHGGRLALVELEPVVLEDPFLAAFERDGDALAYGRAQAGFLRGFLEPSFRVAWSRPMAEQSDLADAVFADAASRLSADPRAVSPRYRLVVGRAQRLR